MRMRPEELSSLFDSALAEGLRNAWSGQSGGHGGLHEERFDVSECLRELAGLKSSEDFCYDRPGSPFWYASWYHGARVNQVTAALTDCLSELIERDRPWTVIDLGSGTGAVAWAIVAAHFLTGTFPSRCPIQMTAVESSWPMLRLAKALWASLRKTIGESVVDQIVQISDWLHRSWPLLDQATKDTDLLTAHYLFDHSESCDQALDESSDLFRKQLQNQRVKRLFCCTSSSKNSILVRLASTLQKHEWSVVGPLQLKVGPLAGALHNTARFRQERRHLAGDAQQRLLNQFPEYRSDRYPAKMLLAESRRLFEDSGVVSETLTEGQMAALDDQHRNVLIRGAAGSGKTIVMIHRLVREIQRFAQAPGDMPSLFVTFNKKLLEFTRNQLLEALRKTKLQERLGIKEQKDNYTVLTIGDLECVHFGTLDSVVSRRFELAKDHVFGSPKDLLHQAKLIVSLPENLADLSALPKSIRASWWDSVDRGQKPSTDPAVFLAEEYRSIFFGRAGCDSTRYLDKELVSREGRGSANALQSSQRAACCRLLQQFTHKYLERRCEALAAPVKPGASFESIYIDEAQDLTDVDFALLDRLKSDMGGWTVAFDTTQMIRPVANFRPPAVFGGWSRHTLEGSYRIPLRLCEALGPLVGEIRSSQDQLDLSSSLAAVRPVPSRLAAIGSRPIVVAAQSEAEFSKRFRQILFTFTAPEEIDRQIVFVLESDRPLCGALAMELGDCATIGSSSILREKGLEFPWLVWSTRSECQEPVSSQQLCYTVLSRSSGHVVIWLPIDITARPCCSEEVGRIFGTGRGALRRDRLLVLDELTSAALEHLT